jgi:hypothetical protein
VAQEPISRIFVNDAEGMGVKTVEVGAYESRPERNVYTQGKNCWIIAGITRRRDDIHQHAVVSASYRRPQSRLAELKPDTNRVRNTSRHVTATRTTFADQSP